MTLYIIIITAIVSIAAFQNRSLMAKLMFNAYLVKHSNEWFRVISHAFVHSGWMHLFVNMWVLWIFGELVENAYEAHRGATGVAGYLALYLGGILFSTLPSFQKHQNNFNYNAVGASGAVAAVLFSAIYFAPTMSLYVMFIPIPIPAVIFGVAYLALEWYLDKNSNDNVAHDAHFWGAAFGFSFSLLMFPSQFGQFVNEILNRFLP
ncbi:MAG: rhomboid family intramembrane serine protease [Flavobacteriales bacterium]|nr:rhomboid family intramembrane serine protease [Flavobacteriales bacterium]